MGAGELVTYIFTYTNAGGAGTSVTLTANTPVGTTFDSTFPPAASAPAAGGTGAITWALPNVPKSGSGVVALRLRIDPTLTDGTTVVLTGYQITAAGSPLVTGPDLPATVRVNRDLAFTKSDRPDPVLPGDTVTYTLVVANRGFEDSLVNLVVRELFDPDLEVLSAAPPAEPGTNDVWTIPVLPAGATKTISIQVRVRIDAIPGTIQRNYARAEDDRGHVANIYQDTVVANPATLSASLEDNPDPAPPGSAVDYAFSFLNLSHTDLTGVVVTAIYDPGLTLISAYPLPDAGTTDTWTIGDLPARSAGRVYATLSSGPPNMTPGSSPQVWMIVRDSTGASAVAVETTVFTPIKPPFNLELVGVPRNPRVGATAGVIYSIRVTNQASDAATSVTVTDVLPAPLAFLDSSPPPSLVAGDRAVWQFPRIDAFTSKLIQLQAALDPTTDNGTQIENVATVTDQLGNFVQKSFTGSVRSTPSSKPPLTLSMSTLKRATAGNQLRYSFNVKNNKPVDATNVTLTVTLPTPVTFVSASPRVGTHAGQTVSWKLGRIPSNRLVVANLSVQVNAGTPVGTSLPTSATATNGEGDSASAATETTVVR